MTATWSSAWASLASTASTSVTGGTTTSGYSKHELGMERALRKAGLGTHNRGCLTLDSGWARSHPYTRAIGSLKRVRLWRGRLQQFTTTSLRNSSHTSQVRPKRTPMSWSRKRHDGGDEVNDLPGVHGCDVEGDLKLSVPVAKRSEAPQPKDVPVGLVDSAYFLLARFATCYF